MATGPYELVFMNFLTGQKQHKGLSHDDRSLANQGLIIPAPNQKARTAAR